MQARAMQIIHLLGLGWAALETHAECHECIVCVTDGSMSSKSFMWRRNVRYSNMGLLWYTKETRKTTGTASKRLSGPAFLWFLTSQGAADVGQARGLCGLISISLSQC